MIKKILITGLLIMGMVVLLGTASAVNSSSPTTITKSIYYPDLTVNSITNPKQALRGNKIIIRNSILNHGNSAAGSFTTTFYLRSTTGTFTKLGTRTITSLGTGKANTQNTAFTVPTTTPQGYYTIKIITDSSKRIIESNENNNQRTSTSSTRIIDPVNKPSSKVKLVFIHHSSGGNWLQDGNGNLGYYLNQNNYYVSETDYGWSAEPGDSLGDRTDTINWPEWFNNRKMSYVYRSSLHSAYNNRISNPGGENQIVMFKSCFPNSEVGSSISDEKAIYNSLKPYFTAHPEKLFVLITPPGETDVDSYQLTRQLCNWLVDRQNGWLKGYTGKNVMVFDFYGVLSEVNSHHRWINNHVEHVYASNYDGHSPYHDGDDHPNAAGNQKAAQEFTKLLNYAYNLWKS